MSKSSATHYVLFMILLLFVLVWTTVLLYIGPETLVNTIGIRNGYLLMFLVSLFGGVSSVGGAIYVTTILSLAAGGLHPLYLAFASGAGVSVGDSVYYYLGYRGSHLLPSNSALTAHIQQFSNWLTRQARWLRALAIYCYVAFTPLPNDILTILMGVTRQPYGLVLSALVVGNMTHTLLLATVGRWLF